MSDVQSGSASPPLDRKFILGLVLIAVAVYANSLWNGFAYDDDWIIVRNDRVHQLKDLASIWGTPYWPAFGAELGLYRPLAIFAYALQWAAGDGAPWIFHAVNVALHALVSVLVFLLLRALVPVWPAALGALVFAVHPVHTEVVANSVGQAELLAAAALLTACVSHATRPREAARYSWWRLAAIAALYSLALLAKEAAITLPALLVLLDVTQQRVTLGKQRMGNYLRHTWLLFFVMASAAILYLSIRADVLGSISGLDAGPGLPFLKENHRVLTAFRAWPEYVRLLFFPKDLSADYSPAVILPVYSVSPMAALGAFMLIATIVVAALTPRYPQAGFPAAWFFITILTVSNLLFPIGVVVAERTLYLPSVAAAALFAFACHAYAPRFTRRQGQAATVAFAGIVALMSFRTIVRNPEWKSTIVVLRSVVRDHPESYHSAWLLADQYWRRGDIRQSAYYWEAAFLLWPRDSQLMSEFANFNIGRRNWKRAIGLLEQSRAMHPWVPRTQELLAFSYVHAGRPAEAIQTANETFRLGGNNALLYAVKARAYEEQGRHGPAIGAWRAAIRAKHGNLWLYKAMQARALARYGDREAALAIADSAILAHARDAVAAPTLKQVRTSIVAGCYQGVTCTDPLAGWGLMVEQPPQNVPNSQIAKPAAPQQRAAAGTIQKP